MKKLALLLAAAALGSLGATGMLSAAKPAAPAAGQRDWSKVVAATPDGGFRMGNPGAAVKLIEYGSLTCPHCAHFDEEGVPQLVQKYVRTGRISYEFRNFIRDPYDMAAALLSRCAGPAGYFPFTRQIFATQEAWTARFGALSASDYDALEALAPMPKLARIAAISGLEAQAARFGVPPARAKACLSDEKAVKQLTDMRQTAVTKYELKGTPMFIVNGKTQQALTWASLEPLLSSPGG